MVSKGERKSLTISGEVRVQNPLVGVRWGRNGEGRFQGEKGVKLKNA